jgi:hypothetical protein
MGTLVPGTYTSGAATLARSIDDAALFRERVLYQFNAIAPGSAQFLAVHLGSVTIAVTPADNSLQGGRQITIQVEAPSHLGTEGADVDEDVVNTADRTGVPPQFIKAQVWQESFPKWNRLTYRYEPLASGVGEFDVSFGMNLRTVLPYANYRLATALDLRNAQLSAGDLLSTADIAVRSNLFVGCDQSGQNGIQLGGLTNPSNPSIYEIFRCNDHGGSRMNWSNRLSGRALQSRLAAIRSTPLTTAQTALAASYGLLQTTAVVALERSWWRGSDGSRNPSLLFDTPETVALESNSLLLGTRIVRSRLANTSAQQGVAFAPDNYDSNDSEVYERLEQVQRQ